MTSLSHMTNINIITSTSRRKHKQYETYNVCTAADPVSKSRVIVHSRKV